VEDFFHCARGRSAFGDGQFLGARAGVAGIIEKPFDCGL